MSSFVRRSSKRLRKWSGIGVVSDMFKPDMPDKPPASSTRPPSIDDARRRQDEADRIRRRRGVLANIFGGGSASAPTVGMRTLLGGTQ